MYRFVYCNLKTLLIMGPIPWKCHLTPDYWHNFMQHGSKRWPKQLTKNIVSRVGNTNNYLWTLSLPYIQEPSTKQIKIGPVKSSAPFNMLMDKPSRPLSVSITQTHPSIYIHVSVGLNKLCQPTLGETCMLQPSVATCSLQFTVRKYINE
jgi:hypothetical protein